MLLLVACRKVREINGLTERAKNPGMSTQLDLAEAVGMFRRILPEEDVSIMTPWETVTTHPRHKNIP